MNLDAVTVLILTYNEEANLDRTLAALSRFSDIVVLDSGSEDATRRIIERYPNARCVTRKFDSHEAQWNYGLTACGISREWVLALDADFVMSAAGVAEIAELQTSPEVAGYRASFRYCIFGEPLSAALYPPVVVLYRRALASYVQEGHTQRVVVRGAVERLQAPINHDDRKTLDRWMSSQQRYARLEAAHLLALPRAKLRRTDRVRLWGWVAPFIVPAYVLLIKRCIFSGRAGWLYTMQRMFAEVAIALAIADLRSRPAGRERGEEPRT